MDKLAFVADARGASAVCAFLRENRKDVSALLDALAQPVLLDPQLSMESAAGAGDGKDSGIHMEERMSLRAQREVWSALLRFTGGDASGGAASPVAHAQVQTLAARFLQCAEKKRRRAPDPVCRLLAQMVVAASREESSSTEWRREVDDDESLSIIKRDAAFKEAMKQLTFARMAPHSSLLAALSPASGGDSDTRDAPFQQRQRTVLMSFTRATTISATTKPATPGRSRARLHSALVTQSTADDPDARAMTKRSRAMVEQGAELSLPSTQATTGGAMHEAPMAVQFPRETEEKALKLAKQLASSEAQASRAAMDDVAKATVQLIQETINATTATQQATEAVFAKLCETLQLARASDEALFQVTIALVESNWSSRYASVFLETSVFPKIVAAASVISRVLLQTALLFAQRYTSALVESLLIPLLTASAIGSAQGEAITRILRNGVPPEQIDAFLSKSFQVYEQQQQHASSVGISSDRGELGETRHFFTNDAALMVLQNVLTMKAPLADATIEKFVACCEAAQETRDGADLHKSLKFATLVFTMVSKYADQCAAHAEALEGIGKRLTSLMAKSTMRAILKLKSASGAVTR